MEWADVVRWNGNTYSLDEEKSRQGDYRIPHEELSVVSFTVVGSEEEENPAYELRDHEATMAPTGTRIQSIKGIDPDQYILVGNNVYRVRD
ncbi:hypothetical protein [Bacillus sp. KH172YL63]|uniref:hypothetical protein n=1 Tax=Bacillus sp. KH172YL63 TaxID=2709784 RepID=UPI0013E50EFE|nr:hypothetical protein [Bacillus sp. KH172YL63]BCB03967.1 hypothetical protein KH172YL63_21000 [Bacillus sp. KH172YL63]